MTYQGYTEGARWLERAEGLVKTEATPAEVAAVALIGIGHMLAALVQATPPSAGQLDQCGLCRQPIDDDIHLPGAVSTYHPFASVPVPGS